MKSEVLELSFGSTVVSSGVLGVTDTLWKEKKNNKKLPITKLDRG